MLVFLFYRYALPPLAGLQHGGFTALDWVQGARTSRSSGAAEERRCARLTRAHSAIPWQQPLSGPHPVPPEWRRLLTTAGKATLDACRRPQILMADPAGWGCQAVKTQGLSLRSHWTLCAPGCLDCYLTARFLCPPPPLCCCYWRLCCCCCCSCYCLDVYFHHHCSCVG